MQKSLHYLSIAWLFAGACAEPSDVPVAGIRLAQQVNNDELLNNSNWNNFNWNNFNFNNFNFNNFNFNNFNFNNFNFNNFNYNGTALGGTYTFSVDGWKVGGNSKNGITISGTDFDDPGGGAISPSSLTGATLNGTLTINTRGTLPFFTRIDQAAYDANFGGTVYKVSYSLDNITWQSLCPGDVAAIPIVGSFDNSTGGRVSSSSTIFSFACDGAALAKCVKWGYKQDGTRQECNGSGSCKQQPLSYWHQACTRMVRADYCGDGVPHTRSGTLIDEYDNLGIAHSTDTVGSIEADWSVDGAHCIRHTRWGTADSTTTGGLTDLQYVTANCPQRLASQDSNCDSNPNHATDSSNYPSANGYNADLSTRRLLRNDSYSN